MYSYSELCIRAVVRARKQKLKVLTGLEDFEEVASKRRLREQSCLGVLPFKQVVRKGLSEEASF